MLSRQTRVVRRTLFLAAPALFFLAALARPSAPRQIPSPKDVVAPSAYATRDPVTRSSDLQVIAVLRIRQGFHINARRPSADYLIPTDLRPAPTEGFAFGNVVYPKGELHSFTFSKTPLKVYEGTVKLQFRVTVLANAPLGAQKIPLKLRYQACSTDVCLPPVTVTFDAPLNVTAPSASSSTAHP